MPRLLYPRVNSPRYPLDRRLDGPQSRSEHSGGEEAARVVTSVMVRGF